jgi:hypothetical protein
MASLKIWQAIRHLRRALGIPSAFRIKAHLRTILRKKLNP